MEWLPITGTLLTKVEQSTVPVRGWTGATEGLCG